MTDLDQALAKFVQDENEQAAYYDLVLNTRFYIPTRDGEAVAGQTAVSADDTFSPLLLEAEGKRYMLLFDREERLGAWAKQPAPYVALPGHALAGVTPPDLHWAVNVGTGYAKEFVPEEIGWLREVLRKSSEEAQGED